MRHKSISGAQIKDADQGQISAVIATFDVADHDGDVVMREAFTEGETVRLSAYNHASWGPGELPVGKGAIRTTETEAIFDGEFFLGTAAGRDTFEVVKEMGGLQEYSWGFDVITADMGELNGESVQYLRDVKVHEVSPVLLGASIGTRTLAVKSRDMKLTEHIEAVLADVDALTERAADVKAKRQEKGKSLGVESKDLLEKLEPALKELAAVLTDDEPSNANNDVLLEVERGRIHLRR